MLIGFTVGNFGSIADEQRLSLVLGKVGAGYSGRPCTLIYGPNASGKSTILHAIDAMRTIIRESSAGMNESEPLPVKPHLFRDELAMSPSRFELTVAVNGLRYRYGFFASRERIHSEYLYVNETRKAQEWFRRETQATEGGYEYCFSPAFKGAKETWKKATRDNALFLSTATRLGSAQLAPLFLWASQALDIVFTSDVIDPGLLGRIDDRGFAGRVLELLKLADPSISDFKVEDTGVMIHRRLGSMLLVSEIESESAGTSRMFGLALHIVNALETGSTLLIDELDTDLHPFLVGKLIELFRDEASNPRGAQLVAAMHNTYPLRDRTIDRSSFWFVQKGMSNATTVSCLGDTPARNNEAREKSYLEGRYGALPEMAAPSSSMEE